MILCPHCNERPVKRDARGRPMQTCGDHRCKGLASFEARQVKERQLHWPKITGPVVADFRPHNIKTNDGGMYRIQPHERM